VSRHRLLRSAGRYTNARSPAKAVRGKRANFRRMAVGWRNSMLLPSCGLSVDHQLHRPFPVAVIASGKVITSFSSGSSSL
jgi:hypothetical protein